jgi:hypothetical protein
MSYLRYLCLLVHSGVQHLLCCGVFVLFCFGFFFGGGRGSSCVMPASLDCPFLIVPLVFSMVYLERKRAMFIHIYGSLI